MEWPSEGYNLLAGTIKSREKNATSGSILWNKNTILVQGREHQ